MGLFGGGSGLFGGRSSSYGGGGFWGGSSSLCKEKSVIRDPSADIDRFRNSDTIAGDLIRTLDDAKAEFRELCTDGFVEMVIKGNKDYKTSFEIAEEADEKIEEAYQRFYTRCHEFNLYLEKLNTQINDLYKKKEELAKLVNENVKRMSNMPKISTDMDVPIFNYKESTISMICDYSGIGRGLDFKRRKESANEYLEDANDFEVEVYSKIAEINRVEAFLDVVKMNMEEEEEILDALKKSIEKKRKLAYDKIAEQLHILISEYILDPDGTKNEKYMNAVTQLKRIN